MGTSILGYCFAFPVSSSNENYGGLTCVKELNRLPRELALTTFTCNLVAPYFPLVSVVNYNNLHFQAYHCVYMCKPRTSHFNLEDVPVSRATQLCHLSVLYAPPFLKVSITEKKKKKKASVYEVSV